MARARIVKPGFFSNEALTETHPFGRLLFIGLWTLADREGRLMDRPLWIKGQLFPYEKVPVDKLLGELEGLGFIMRYVVEGEPYIQVMKFKNHQHPHVKEAESIIPSPFGPVPSPVISGASPDLSGTSPSVTNTVTDPVTETVPESLLQRVKVEDPLDQVLADFAAFGKTTAGTVSAIDEAVSDYGLEWVQKAIRKAAGGGFTDKPPWSYVESILERWKAKGEIDKVEPDAAKPMGRNAVGPQAPLDTSTAIRLAYPNIQQWPELDTGGGDDGVATLDGGHDPARLEVRG